MFELSVRFANQQGTLFFRTEKVQTLGVTFRANKHVQCTKTSDLGGPTMKEVQPLSETL